MVAAEERITKTKRVKRRSPAGGYRYPAKAEFRRWVWDRIGGFNETTGETHTGDVLIMPSIEGCEIEDEALPRQFRPDQLHVADKNPAIVATLQRRFPGIKTYGCLVDKACERISKKGINLIAANIDFCSQLTLETVRSVRAISTSPACKSASLFITILRGREERFLQDLIVRGSGETGWDKYLERQSEAAFLANENGEFWDTSNGIKPTRADLWRIKVLHKTTERKWAEARAYVSINGQSFLTVWFLPKDYQEPEEELDERDNGLASLRSLANSGDPGDPLPDKDSGERAVDYRARLNDRQKLRLHLVSQQMGISELSLISGYVPEVKR
jgi:hypothetical protein